MFPAELLFLLLAAAESESAAENSTGLNFIVVFPENIAFYHPTAAEIQVHVTALRDDTQVTIRAGTIDTDTKTLSAGQTENIEVDARLELQKSEISDRTLQITSDKHIMVQAVSLKQGSVQSALVLPTDKLSTEYPIPPVPRITGTNDPEDAITPLVTERGPFKIIVVNADQENKVTVEGAVPSEVSLRPYQNAQISVNASWSQRALKTQQPAAVLFSHACAMKYNCTCGMLYTPLPPASQDKLKYPIPPALAGDTETFMLLSEEGSTKVEAFDPDSPLVETSGTIILYRPSLLLTLIPETDFASCYVISALDNMQNFAVIVVHKDLTNGVRIGSGPPQDPDWQDLKGTDYVSTAVLLAVGKNVVWHESSKIAVYLLGENGDSLFGNPAPVVSRTPDFRGCLVSPGVVEIGQVADGWRESISYCRDRNMTLVSLPGAQLRGQVIEQILRAVDDGLREVWIGMRRSSLTGEWYWHSGEPVADTNWADGEPGSVRDGQCVSMSLEKSKNFGWRDEDCCEKVRPVCYRDPVLLPL